MAVVPGSVEFLMGSPASESGRSPDEQLHRKRIGRTFAIATKPVTVAEFLRFRPGQSYSVKYAPTSDCPITAISWYDAAAYCNWLSSREGIPQEQWCYEPNLQGEFADGMKFKPAYLNLTGYRLPTEAEWEYACRAGTKSSRYYGDSEELLGKYAWFMKNSDDRTWPVGILMPNDLGLFDMYGNVWCWCQDSLRGYPESEKAPIADDNEDILVVTDRYSRVLRGNSFSAQAATMRSALRSNTTPGMRNLAVGFRPARTLNVK